MYRYDLDGTMEVLLIMDVDSRGGIYKRKATAAEDAAMSAALEEIRAGEYVTHDAISWE